MEFHLGKMQIAGSAILFHYFLAAVHHCCGNIFLPSSSFSHSIIATLWQLQVLFITNCNGQFFFTALFLHRGPSLLWRYYFITSSPLSSAVRPVFTYSRIPKGSRSFIRLSIFSSLPVASTTTLSGATSIIWAR